MELLNGLNNEQIAAVKQVDGPVMVFAGAGTGKTKTLITRIAYMIDEKLISPSNILAITFTKKATNEMRNRLDTLIGEKARFVHISTMHALCATILRKCAKAIGYGYDFEIIDDDEQVKIMNEVYKKTSIAKTVLSPKVALKAIGDYKNRSCFELLGLLQEAYEGYQNYLIEHNLMDFEDLLVNTVKLFNENPEILNHYQDIYKYILVDELQDTNSVQYELINLLSLKYENIFAVGDDDQSIYSFRGAKIENMMKFRQDHQNARVIKLVQNYRTTNQILKGSNALIKNNKIREPKELFSETEGSKNDVSIQEAYYYEDEIRFVVNEIATLVNHKGYNYSDIAVIYRNSALSRNFEITFASEKIPYNIYGSYSFLKRKEIKDIISYLRFIASPNKMFHFKRIINVPSRGVGDKTIEKLNDIILENGCDILEAIDIFKTQNTSSKTTALLEFKKTMLELIEDLNNYSFLEFFDIMLEKTGYLKWIKENEETLESRREDNVLEFKSILKQLDDEEIDEGLSRSDILEIGLDGLLLDTTVSDDSSNDGVVLSTIHSVKGLEFRAVFVIGAEEGIFPAIREEVDMEEERRVAYVAFTRAKEKLYITCTSSRLIYGRIVRNKKSRFLLEYLSGNKAPNITEEKKQVVSNTNITVGSRVSHKFFGNGLVIAKDERFVQILFDKDKSIKKIASDHPTISLIVD